MISEERAPLMHRLAVMFGTAGCMWFAIIWALVRLSHH